MAVEFKKLSEVEKIEELSDSASVLVEAGGAVKRVAKEKVGGGSGGVVWVHLHDGVICSGKPEDENGRHPLTKKEFIDLFNSAGRLLFTSYPTSIPDADSTRHNASVVCGYMFSGSVKQINVFEAENPGHYSITFASE